MKKSTPPKETAIVLPRLDLQSLEITLVGDSALIVHAWSEKAKKQMLDKQMKRATQAREAKDPQKDYEDSLYHHPAGGYGFPSIGAKACAVSAATFAADVTKVLMRGAFHIDEELVKIKGDPSMREDMVRLNGMTSDIRYRAEFKKWSTKFIVKYNCNVLSAEQITNMFELGGFHVGLGEWRPSRNGSFGRFHVARRGEKI